MVIPLLLVRRELYLRLWIPNNETILTRPVSQRWIASLLDPSLFQVSRPTLFKPLTKLERSLFVPSSPESETGRLPMLSSRCSRSTNLRESRV